MTHWLGTPSWLDRWLNVLCRQQSDGLGEQVSFSLLSFSLSEQLFFQNIEGGGHCHSRRHRCHRHFFVIVVIVAAAVVVAAIFGLLGMTVIAKLAMTDGVPGFILWNWKATNCMHVPITAQTHVCCRMHSSLAVWSSQSDPQQQTSIIVHLICCNVMICFVRASVSCSGINIILSETHVLEGTRQATDEVLRPECQKVNRPRSTERNTETSNSHLLSNGTM